MRSAWRTTLDGYICCVESRQKDIQKILELGRRFKTEGQRRHVSVLMTDSPGTGKSFLAKCLAQTLGLPRIEFNISQLNDPREVVDCFDEIVTMQLRSDTGLLVFVDEIDTRFGRHVYHAFLSPVESGVYRRGGEAFQIRPCMWIFAGSSASRVDKEQRKDFRDRMSLKIHLQADSQSDPARSQVQMERVYLGVSELIGAFPEVTHVSNKVLEVFSRLPAKYRPREIRQLVDRFQYVNLKRVVLANVPAGSDARGLASATGSEEMVAIERKPSWVV